MSNRLIETLRKLLKGDSAEDGQLTSQQQTSPSQSANPLVINERTAAKLMQALEETQNVEYNCEETFALLDEYADLVAGRSEAASLMPLVKHHLDRCPDCDDRYKTLLSIIQT